MARANIVSPEAVHFLTAKIYLEVDEAWLPDDFIVAQLAQRNHDGSNIGNVDIEHVCTPVVHPVTGETITSYKKLANDPIHVDHGIWQRVWTYGPRR